MHGRALRSVAVQFFVNGAAYASFIPRLPELRGQVGISLSAVGLILTLSALAGLAGSASVGWAIDRFGSNRVMAAGTLIVAAMLPVIGLSAGPIVLLIALTLLQFFDVGTDAAMNLQASRISALRPVPVMNRMHGLWSLGTVAGGMAAAALAAAAVSIRVHLVAAGALLAATTLYIVPGLLSADSESAAESAPPMPPRRRWSALASVLVLGMAALVVEIVPTEWASFRLSEDLGAGPGAAGLGFVAFTTGMVAGRFGGDWATVRFGRRRLNRMAVAATAAGTAVATLVPSKIVTLGAFVVAGSAAAVLLPILYDDAARARGRPGGGLGALTAGIRIGAIVAPIMVGALADRPWSTVGLAMAVVSLPFAVVLWFIRPAEEAQVAPGR